jgi:hypothetical protein
MKKFLANITSILDAIAMGRTAAYLYRSGRWEDSKKMLSQPGLSTNQDLVCKTIVH